MLASLIAKNFIQRPLRYVLTGLSIAFGVAAVTAVFIFTDGLRTTFDELAGNIQSGFDVAVRNDTPFGDGTAASPVPLELLPILANFDGVVAAQPRIIEFGVVPIDGDGEAAVANGPNIGLNWESRTPNPRLFLIDGREPTGPSEFAMDIDAFNSGAFTVGDNYRVLTPAGSLSFDLVGTFNYGDAETNASVGAMILAFEENEALEVLNAGRGYDDITLVGSGDPEELVSRLAPILADVSPTLVAESQATLIEETQGDFGQILTIFRTVLLVFAAIILLVSAYLIFNVFTITLGQRIKELGLLRAIGAFGSQVTTMMLGEAFFLGVVATLVGLPAGWVLARVLRFGLSQLGFPGDTGLPINPLTIVFAVLVGVVVTMLAAVWPSIRARRVTPMAALRESSSLAELDTDPRPLAGLISIVIGLGLTVLAFSVGGWLAFLLLPVLGAVLLYLGVRLLANRGGTVARFVLLLTGLVLLTVVRFADLGLGETFGLLGAGAVVTIFGASLVSGTFAGPAGRMLGYPVPMGIIVGIIGVMFGLAAVGSVVGAVVIVARGNPAGLLLPFAGVFAAVGCWALVRTAFGAFGLTGRLARENAARNPQRTATTATALMIGLTLVTAVTVIGESIKSSVTTALDSSITADWLIQGPSSGPQGLPFSTDVVDVLNDLDEVGLVVPYRFNFAAFASLEGDANVADVQSAIPRLFAAISDKDANPSELLALRQELGATDFSIDDVGGTDFATVSEQIDPDFVGRDTTLEANGNGIWLEDGVASDRGLAIGDSFIAVFLDGAAEELTVSAIYTDGFVLGERVIDMELWERHLPRDTYAFVSAATAVGSTAEEARAAMEAAFQVDYPVLKVQDRSEFAAEAESQINQTLAVINLLLLLSAGIAILGIAIALSLAVFERTREIGLLRAVGTTRTQTRWIIRWEGVIVAAFGGLVGVVLGVGLGVLATQKMPEFLVSTTAIPVPQLILYIIIAAITGLGAGAFPAWIAGRMNVLEAISHD